VEGLGWGGGRAEASEHRYSRIIKGSPGRTDARINKPAVMNEAGSQSESSRIYPLLIVTEIRSLSLGADMLNQRVVAPVGRKGTAMHLGHALIERHCAPLVRVTVTRGD